MYHILAFFLMIVIVLAVYGWTILWNSNIRISLDVFMPIGFGCLTFCLGIISSNVKPNSFFGVRTPFTLNHEIIWEKTNKLDGILLRIAAIVMLVGAVYPDYMMFFIVIPLLLVSDIESFYSRALWKKLKKDHLERFKPFKQNLEEVKKQLFGKR